LRLMPAPVIFALLAALEWLFAPIAMHGNNKISGNIFFILI
jgi:hypothetical protein